MIKYYYQNNSSQITTQPDDAIPVNNILYNIVIHEAIELDLYISYYYDCGINVDSNDIYLKIETKDQKVTIRFYEDVISIYGPKYSREISYTEYTTLQDLLWLCDGWIIGWD